MSTVNIGWLKNNNGEKFAPKTLSSQVYTSDGNTLENKIKKTAFINSESNEDVTNPDVEMNGVVIDSDFSENSTNPVQNKVVAKNFKKVSDDIEYLKRDWEYIETITVEEDGVKVIERTQEPDGTPYSFKKMKIYVYHPMCSNSGRTGFRFTNVASSNTYACVGTIENLSTISDVYSLFNFEVIDGSLYVDGIVTRSTLPDYETTYVSTCGSSTRRSISLNTITDIAYRSLNGHTLPIGTTMDIYAIRA